jgi:hypothetical protein
VERIALPYLDLLSAEHKWGARLETHFPDQAQHIYPTLGKKEIKYPQVGKNNAATFGQIIP